MHRRWTIAPLLLVAACSVSSPTPSAGDAYVRLAAVPGRPAAGYFVVHGGAADTKLVQIEAPGVARVELHGSRMTGNGMVAMDALPEVPVPARGTVAFAPGARHAMLFGVPATIAPGATMPLTLRFADGAAVRVAAKVIAAGDVAPD